jgi:hypothetical protein
MLITIRKAVVATLVTVLVTFGMAHAQTADPTTNSFALSDEDADGVVDVEEYRNRMIVIMVALDKDEDGYLIESEVPEVQRDVFPVADASGDGKVGLREYLVFVMPRFWKADYDGDNVLSLPEVIAADKREAAY